MDQVQTIQNKIYEIRGQRVMLDFDLAELYQVENRALKQAVRRNIERFPDDFMLRLSAAEANELINIGKSQNVIPHDYNIGSTEMFAFTEEGVAMLSGILRSKPAVQANIAIMRAFVAMRQLVVAPPADRIGQLEIEVQQIREYLEEVFTDQNDINEDTRMQLELVNQTLAELQVKDAGKFVARRPIGFNKEK